MTMSRPFVNTIAVEDYAEIQEGVQAVRRATEWFWQVGGTVMIPHEHRFWEYGSAVQALLSMMGERMSEATVLDVGAGDGALGPALALNYNARVTECEPDAQCRKRREECNRILAKANKRQMQIMDAGLDNLPNYEFDAVFCISVLEHVANEAAAWAQLAQRVKPNGLLFITTDCVEDPNRPYKFDEMREHKFTPHDMESRITRLSNMGFTTMGKPDYQWHGAQVFDYTFFRAGLVRMAGA